MKPQVAKTERGRLVWLVVGLAVVIVVVGACAGGGTSPRTSQPPVTTSVSGTAPTAVSPQTTAPAGSITTGTSPVSTTSSSPARTVSVDVLIYGTQTSGLAALYELTNSSPSLKVAVLSYGQALETPLAQGLCVEDRYVKTPILGFYQKWRDGVMAEYKAEGLQVEVAKGRLSYEPEVSKKVLERLVDQDSAQTQWFVGQLLSASDKDDVRSVEFRSQTGELVRIEARYLIDSSVEADLARMLGTDYRIGRSETVYNDVAKHRPAPPTQVNNFATAPQKMATLLTLETFAGDAPPISGLNNPDYDPSTYAPSTMNVGGLSAEFGNSWTMKIGSLPNSKHELNEFWNDWPDDQVAFAWVYRPEQRQAIFRRVLTRSLNYVRYLQEHGYPHVGIAEVPDLPYVREGPRVVGRDTYTEIDIAKGVSRQSIAVGLYARFDRHQNVEPTFISTPTKVHVPLGALLPGGHPWLLVTTAISADYQAYCSAVRMEPTRANIGGAAGILTALALERGVSFVDLTYKEVHAELASRGYAED